MGAWPALGPTITEARAPRICIHQTRPLPYLSVEVKAVE